MQNVVLHCHAKLGFYNTAHMLTFLDRLHNIVTAEDQWDAEQMRYIVILDNCVSLSETLCIIPPFHCSGPKLDYQHPQSSLQYLSPYSPFLNPTEEFVSAWRWKVYNLQPYVRIPLVQAMEEACD